MLYVNFPQQSTASDWTDTIQIVSEEDNLPLWHIPPTDLVVTMSVKNETRRGFGDVQLPYITQQPSGPMPVIYTTSTDGNGMLTVYDDGFIEYFFPASVMSNLTAGFYEVFIVMTTGGRSIQLITGLLPLQFGQ